MSRKIVSTKSAPRTTTGTKPQAVKPTAAPSQARPATVAPAQPATGRTAISAAPSTEQIGVRAYEIWLRKGRPLGQDTQNWLEAEAELRTKR